MIESAQTEKLFYAALSELHIKQFYLSLKRIAEQVELTGKEPELLSVAYDEASFEKMFKEHFKALHSYASVILQDDMVAEEIVQNMFLKLWEKRHNLIIQSSLKAYLYKCVHHDSLNYLKHLKVKSRYEDHAMYAMKGETAGPAANVEFKELEWHLKRALNELPEQCRTIFQLSRFEELKYREISEQMGISVKTVEKHMSNALKLLKAKLVDFLPLILMMLTHNRFN